jgi:hypothetical protein
MQMSDVDHTLFAGGNAGDETLFVKFENKPVRDKSKTIELGRPIFKEVPHISIRAAGSQSFVCRVATQADKARFPKHLAAFNNKMELPVTGTLLTEFPLVTRTMAMELAAVGVKTVEQMLSMSDQNCQNFMGMNELKKRAKLFLEHAEGDAPMGQLQDDLDAANMTIKSQSEMMARMEARLNALEADKPELMTEPEVALETAKPKPRSRQSRAKK